MKPINIKATYIKRVVSALTLVGCCTAMSCSCPEPHNIAKSQMLRREQSSSSAASNQLVVYLDTSASMAGYVGNDRQRETTFSRTLQELRNFVTLINPPVDVLVRRVDARVGEPLNDMTLSQASIDNRLFNGADTDLAGAFDSFERTISQEAPPRFHVLVTDGVQSTNQQRPDLACTSGSDQLCVRRRIFDLLNKGWGGCVIGLRSGFHGKIYSEINRAQSRPSVLQFDSDDNNPQTFRPFYLYVFSPDRSALEPFVATLIERLKPLTEQDNNSLHVLPLTFQYSNGGIQADANVPKSASSLLTVRKRQTKDLPEFTIAVDAATAQLGPQPFSLSITVPWSKNVLSAGTVQELARLIKWELIPIYPKSPDSNARYPEVKFVGQNVDDAGRILLQGTAQWPPSVGTLCWRGYRLEGRLEPEAMTPQWVRDWSTNLDTTIDNTTKTLYLESGLLGLWRNSVLDKQLIAEAVLVAGKR